MGVPDSPSDTTASSGSGRHVVVHDATLRDGQHAVGHQLDEDQLRVYAAAADRAGVPVVEVGHGNGLGASSLQIGRARLADATMIATVREVLTTSRLGVFMAPGWGRGADVRRAVALGAQVVRVAAHCTEAAVTERHLGLARELGAEAQTVLLMSHMTSPGRLAEQCALAVGFGAQAVGIMDSAGSYLPDDVAERIRAIVAAVGDVPVIFHGHDNLALAVANSLAAVDAGAGIIDGCARGFGAGAGNTRIEVLTAVLDRLGHRTGIDLPALFQAAGIAEQSLMSAQPAIDSISIVSGLAGVFSGFRRPVIDAARQAGVDPREVLVELGRRQAVAGQEDLIAAVVADLSRQHEARTRPLSPPTAPHGGTDMNPELHHLLFTELELDPGQMLADSELQDAGLDSLSMVELSQALERQWGLEISEDELSTVTTFGELDRLVTDRRATAQDRR